MMLAIMAVIFSNQSTSCISKIRIFPTIGTLLAAIDLLLWWIGVDINLSV